MKLIVCLGIVFCLNASAQDSVKLNFRPLQHKRDVILLKKNVLVVRRERFKFTATTKPNNKFIDNSTVSLNGLNYDVRMKFYVNQKFSLVLKTKNPSANSRDFASFGIIFKVGQWKKN